MPEALDRPEVVLRVSDTQLAVDDNHRWAEPLRTGIARAVAVQLARELDGARVSASERVGQPTSDVELTIDVQRLEVSLTEGVVLDVAWTARWANDGPTRTGRSAARAAVRRPVATTRRSRRAWPRSRRSATTLPGRCAWNISLAGEAARMKRTKEPWKCGPPGSVSSALAGGFVAGLVAGVVLVLTRLVIALGVVAFLLRLLPWHAAVRDIVHREFWASLKRAALPLVGDRVYKPGFDAPVVWLAVVVLLVLSICVGVAFGLVARGRSRMATCMIALPFGIGAWLIDLLLVDPSPATVIEAIPSALALAGTFLWFEGRLSRRPSSPR